MNHFTPRDLEPRDDPDAAELEAFADGLEMVLKRDLDRHGLPPELDARLQRMTWEHRPDEARSWPFFVGVGVVVLGLAGGAVWSPLILGGVAALGLAAGAADRLLRRLADRTLAEWLSRAWEGGRR